MSDEDMVHSYLSTVLTKDDPCLLAWNRIRAKLAGSDPSASTNSATDAIKVLRGLVDALDKQISDGGKPYRQSIVVNMWRIRANEVLQQHPA